ncbi:unnamed protein product [Rhizophagus irregularis]|nr:unnamed protein product [Rhizophagus irregularis]CAB4432696.1 unnamed protein product [Rhizophagus irregularis]
MNLWYVDVKEVVIVFTGQYCTKTWRKKISPLETILMDLPSRPPNGLPFKQEIRSNKISILATGQKRTADPEPIESKKRLRSVINHHLTQELTLKYI